jgi:hypothetical protein
MIDSKKFEEIKGLIKDEKDIKTLEIYLSNFQKKSFYNSPLMPILLSAIFAIIGTGFGAWLQGRSNLELEQRKFESSLIISMLEKAENQELAAKNLGFLVKAGLISDEDGKIADLINNPFDIPSFGIVGDQLKEKNDNKNYALIAQQKLSDLGFYDGPLNGIENFELKEAIREFQKSINRPPDGIMNLGTLKWIEDAHSKWENDN